MYRNINRGIFERISEDNFDYRMVDTTKRKSDSPRESLAHLIEVESCYLLGAKEGRGNQWERTKDSELKTKSKTKSKTYLLTLLAKKDDELIAFLSNDTHLKNMVEVKWSDKPVSVLSYLWAMNDHEILHNGWNLALMDLLKIPRFEELKKVWG